MITKPEAPITCTVGRIPTVAFSDEADYESLTTLLRNMDGFIWQVELRDGTSLIGAVKAGGDDTITVTPRHYETYELLPDNCIVVELDDVIRFVYL